VILEWIVPASAIAVAARFLWRFRKVDRDFDGIVSLCAAVFVSVLLVRASLGIEGLAGKIGFGILFSTMAMIPDRFVLRLIRAKRPNEIEDPELFENGELKPSVEFKQLEHPKAD